MKVALSYPGCHRRGGVERVVFECARFLASRRHDVTVFASDWEADTTQPVQYHSVPIPSQPFFLQAHYYFHASNRHLRAADYDVLNTHGCDCPLGGIHWVHSVHRAWLERSSKFRGRASFARIEFLPGRISDAFCHPKFLQRYRPREPQQ